jgi:hypothetical protein
MKTLATGKNINGSEIMLRPGMEGQMALGDDHDPAPTVGIKLVKHIGHDRGLCHSRRFQAGGVEIVPIIDQRVIALTQIDQPVMSEHFFSY